jgi:hypothetical protein
LRSESAIEIPSASTMTASDAATGMWYRSSISIFRPMKMRIAARPSGR